MATFKDQRANGFANGHAGYKNPVAGHFGSLRGGSNPFLTVGAPNMPHHYGENNLSTLANGMGAINIATPNFTPKSNSSTAGSGLDFGAAVPLPQAWMQQQHGQVVYAGGQLLHGQASSMHNTPGVYSPVTPYLAQGTYGYGHHVVDNSPVGNNWAGQAQVSGPEMPMLMTPRRDSASSTEQDVPATPFQFPMYGNGVAIVDRSPSGIFTSATPSPSHMNPGYMVVKPTPISNHLEYLIKQEPSIPRAIPAPNSPPKPLDRCLENRNGETNVYIRGLHPETTDQMLEDWGKRFGDIQSSKSIIDMKTNLCKGFGFIKYYNFEDAENCIRGFHHLGYEVSFARESFYSKLKKFSDDNNTNLYVSNIPKNMNEHELGAVFVPYKVCSSRILRDPSGNGRGVGFARFESREVCEKVIKQFNNTPVRKPGGEEHLIQIRYSDTHEQKMLKQQTAAGRQFRAAEYDLGVAQARGYIGGQATDAEPSNEFEQFLRGVHYVPPVRYPRQFPQSSGGFRNWTAVPRVGSIQPNRVGHQQNSLSNSKSNRPMSGQTDDEPQGQVTGSQSTPATPIRAETMAGAASGYGSSTLGDSHLVPKEDVAEQASPAASTNGTNVRSE